MRRILRVSDPSPGKDRDKILRKLGLSEDDVRISEMLLAQIPPAPAIGESTKPEWLLGYAEPRLRRAKALKILGVSEEELEVENNKNLGSLGVGGRRRSFSELSHNHVIVVPSARRKFSRRMLRKELRRHSTGGIGRSGSVDNAKRIPTLQEVRSLRRQTRANQAEIQMLKNRIEVLEERIEQKCNEN